MSMLLSAQVGQVITPAELLGTEDEVQAGKLVEAEKHLEGLTQRMLEAGL